MSFVNTKQQRLIEETTSNYVKFEDKQSTQYLKLRQEIFQLHSDIRRDIKSGGVTQDAQFKVQSLRFDLDKMVVQYTNHLEELIQLLEINKTFPNSPYQEDLLAQFEILTHRFKTLQDNIVNIKQVQKPLLDKMTVLVKKFHNPVQESKSIGAYDQGSTDLDTNSLEFTTQEVKDMFSGIDFSVDVTQVLQNTRLFHKIGDDKYRFKLTKSLVNESIDDFDKQINSTVTIIQQHIAEGTQIRERWNVNAQKLQRIKITLESEN